MQLQRLWLVARREVHQGAKRARDPTSVLVVQQCVGQPDEAHLTPAVAHGTDQSHNGVNGIMENPDGNRLAKSKNVSCCGFPTQRAPGANLEFQGRNTVVTGYSIHQAHDLMFQVGKLVVRANDLDTLRSHLGSSFLDVERAVLRLRLPFALRRR